VTRALRLGLAGLVAGLAAFAVLAAWSGVAATGERVLGALWVLPLAIAVHATQLLLGAAAWRVFIGPHPSLGRTLALRWIREGVNSLLPVAHIGGALVAARLLAQSGVPAARAGSSTVLDLTVEAATLVPVASLGVAILAPVSKDLSWLPWTLGFIVLVAGGIVGFALAQRAGLLRLVEWAAERIGRSVPVLSGGVPGMHADLLAVAARPGLLRRAATWHLLSWSLGAVEVWLMAAALGVQLSVMDALALESLGMAARGAGFAVPGAIGVQEGGLVLAAGLLGIPPDVGLAVSVLKRLREVLVGLAGLALWHRVSRDVPGSAEG